MTLTILPLRTEPEHGLEPLFASFQLGLGDELRCPDFREHILQGTHSSHKSGRRKSGQRDPYCINPTAGHAIAAVRNSAPPGWDMAYDPIPLYDLSEGRLAVLTCSHWLDHDAEPGEEQDVADADWENPLL